MGQHEPLTLSLDDTLDISFADELLSQFDFKRDLLHTSNTSISNDNIMDKEYKTMLTSNNTKKSINSNKLNYVSPPILPPVKQRQMNNDHKVSARKVNQDSIATPEVRNVTPTSEPITLSYQHNIALDTTLPPSFTSLETPQRQPEAHQQQHGVSMDSSEVKTKSTPASLPGTIADRTQRRQQRNHNLLRRSSTYLRQKFFSAAAAADDTAKSPPPLPSFDPISIATTQIPNNDTTTDGVATTVAPNDTGNENPPHINRTKAASPLSPPPTPPSSSTPIIPSSPSSSPPPPPPVLPPPPPSTNPDMVAAASTIVTPVISPCRYPPKPLHYCPVDPPDDRHRASFPLFSSWRKKSLQDPRRQSEPTITSQHIKTRRSFFFL